MGSRGLLAGRRVLIAPLLISFFGIVACAGSSEPTTTTLTPSTTTSRPPTTTAAPTTTVPGTQGLTVLPHFIQGVIPGEDLRLLVTLSDPGGGPVAISAEAPGAVVTVTPDRISGTEVAEVSIVPDPVITEAELSITITATPPGETSTVRREVTVVPWEDDRGAQAAEILGLFTGWLVENRPDLNIAPQTESAGTFTAPLLLVVSHYTYFNAEWEMGLSWHVMIPPDDFAELYLRRRGEPAPVLAFRVGSWQTALETGVFEIAEVEPPSEVVR